MRNLIYIFIGLSIYLFSANSTQAVIIDDSNLPTYGAIDISTAWANILATYQPEIDKYENQNKLATGFANANTYAVSAASLDGYMDYNIFALMSGAMLGIQMPSFSFNRSQVENMRYQIEEEGDIYSGAGIGASLINAGVNAGFIYPGLFINLKFGYLSLNGKNLNSDLEGYLYKTQIYGIGINQVLFWPRTIVPGLFRWRGILIGSGFYYSKTETSITINKALITRDIDGTNTLILDPSFYIKLSTMTMTVPLEIYSSMKFFSFLNYNIGTGADFNYGYSEINLKAAGSISVQDDTGTTITPTTPGYVTITGGTKKTKPVLINPKITTGIGFNLGPFKIDIPVAIYYLQSGFSLGLSAGLVW